MSFRVTAPFSFLVLVASCGDDGSSDPSKHRDRHTREAVDRVIQAKTAGKAARLRAEEAELRSAKLAEMTPRIDQLAREIEAAQLALESAKTVEEQQRSVTELKRLMGEMTEMRRQLDAIEASGQGPQQLPAGM